MYAILLLAVPIRFAKKLIVNQYVPVCPITLVHRLTANPNVWSILNADQTEPVSTKDVSIRAPNHVVKTASVKLLITVQCVHVGKAIQEIHSPYALWYYVSYNFKLQEFIEILNICNIY